MSNQTRIDFHLNESCPGEPSSMAYRSVTRCSSVRRNPVGLILLILLLVTPLLNASDDYENTHPTAWWMDTSRTLADVNSDLAKRSARIVYLKYDNFSPYPFTVVSVKNAGTYQRSVSSASWFYGIDDVSLNQLLANGDNRLVSFEAYDIGQGKIRFAGSMIPNTGADKKNSKPFYGLTAASLQSLAGIGNIRFVSLRSYLSLGQTLYAGIWIDNTGANNRAWSYGTYPPQTIKSLLTKTTRLLDINSAGGGLFNFVLESCSGPCPTSYWDYGKSFKQMQDLAEQKHLRIITADTYPCNDSYLSDYCFVSIMMEGTSGPISAGINRGVEPNPPLLRGFVDLHTHPLSTLGFGGLLIYGGIDDKAYLPHDPDCNNGVFTTNGINQALGHDRSTHGGYNLIDNQCGNLFREFFIHKFQNATQDAADETGDAFGAPYFKEWPVWNDITHQKMWVDWIKRAYDGGLRVMVALAVNNKTLADIIQGGNLGPPTPPWLSGASTDDKSSADTQIQLTKDFVARHDTFMQVALSSDDLHTIVSNNKLAVILGLEIDKIGNFNGPSNSDISAEIQRLYDEGVRYVFPVHVIDNAFGGTAAYIDPFNYSNRRESGHWWKLGCDNDGSTYHKVTYHWSSSGAEYVGLALITTGLVSAFEFTSTPNYTDNNGQPCTLGERNQAPITDQGKFAMREMMRHGMLIDLDRMSQNTFVGALTEAQNVQGFYPVISGHATPRLGGGSERNPRLEDYLKIGTFGGMAGVGSANIDACVWTMYAEKVLQAMDFDPTMGQLNWAGIGFGTDTDGLAMGMPPSPSKNPPSAGSPAVMAAPESKQMHIFYLDGNGSIQHVFKDGDGHMHQEIWAGPGSPNNAPDADGDPIAADWPADKTYKKFQQHIWYRAKGGAIEHVYWDPNSLLHTAEQWGTFAVGKPAAFYLIRNPTGHHAFFEQHVFYRNDKGFLMHAYWDSDFGLHAPEKWAQSMAGDPAATYFDDIATVQMHVFYRDAQNNIQHVYCTPSGRSCDLNKELQIKQWAGPGSPNNAPSAGGNPVAMAGTDKQGNKEIRVLYPDLYPEHQGDIQQILWNSVSGLNAAQAWTGQGGWSSALPTASDPVAVAIAEKDGSTTVDLVYRDVTNSIQHLIWNSATGGKKTEPWAAAIPGPPTIGPLAVGDPGIPGGTLSGDENQEIFYRSIYNGIWHVYHDEQGLHAETWAPESDPRGAAALASDNNFTEYCDYYRTHHPACSTAPVPGCVSTYAFTQQKTWNYDTDGVAHFGMLPDFLKDVRNNIPGGDELVDNAMMYGAEYLYQLWRTAEERENVVPKN